MTVVGWGDCVWLVSVSWPWFHCHEVHSVWCRFDLLRAVLIATDPFEELWVTATAADSSWCVWPGIQEALYVIDAIFDGPLCADLALCTNVIVGVIVAGHLRLELEHHRRRRRHRHRLRLELEHRRGRRRLWRVGSLLVAPLGPDSVRGFVRASILRH